MAHDFRNCLYHGGKETFVNDYCDHIVGKRVDLRRMLAQGETYTYRIKQRPDGANDMTWIIACINSCGKVVSEAIIPRAPYLADDAAIKWAIKHGQWTPVEE
jgi:hypothetical protein